MRGRRVRVARLARDDWTPPEGERETERRGAVLLSPPLGRSQPIHGSRPPPLCHETMPHPVRRNDTLRSPRLRCRSTSSPAPHRDPVPPKTPSLPTRRSVLTPSLSDPNRPDRSLLPACWLKPRERERTPRRVRWDGNSATVPQKHRTEFFFWSSSTVAHSSTGWRAACCASGLLSMPRPRASSSYRAVTLDVVGCGGLWVGLEAREPDAWTRFMTTGLLVPSDSELSLWEDYQLVLLLEDDSRLWGGRRDWWSLAFSRRRDTSCEVSYGSVGYCILIFEVDHWDQWIVSSWWFDVGKGRS